MQQFSELYTSLDRSTATLDKLSALRAYFSAAPAQDAAWALHFLLGGKLRRLASGGTLRELAGVASGYSPWIVEACYAHVGDLAETLALLTPALEQQQRSLGLAGQVAELEALRGGFVPPSGGGTAETSAGQALMALWGKLPAAQRLVLNKLLTGGLRVGVSRGLVQRALAELSGLDPAIIAHRLMGQWRPSAAAMDALLAPAEQGVERFRPFPFALASSLEGEVAALGPCGDWLAEWKWDGIRAQLLHRGAEPVLWSRGEERLDGRFPELEQAAASLSRDVVLDGEILVWRDGTPQPFVELQKRIGKLKPSAALQARYPVVFIAYDLLEANGLDLRQQPFQQRRALLETMLCETPDPFGRSPLLHFDDWSRLEVLRTQSRQRGVEGLMLKRANSVYRGGRKRGDWWKWKVEPYSIDAVMIYAQSGHGRRSNLYTDYTFAVFDGDRLVPVAKAYSGLTDKEILRLDKWIRAHTLERFGPVRSVKPVQVFEIAFEAINPSARHKSGVALRFPRILRWREDKSINQADTLATLHALTRLPATESP